MKAHTFTLVLDGNEMSGDYTSFTGKGYCVVYGEVPDGLEDDLADYIESLQDKHNLKINCNSASGIFQFGLMPYTVSVEMSITYRIDYQIPANSEKDAIEKAKSLAQNASDFGEIVETSDRVFKILK